MPGRFPSRVSSKLMTNPFPIRLSVALGTAALFTFFLAASSPHRVHHLFEQISFPAKPAQPSGDEQFAHHDHAPSHKPHSQPKPINCPVYLAAQQSHLSSVQVVQITFVDTISTGCFDRPGGWFLALHSSRFSQRA